MIIMRILVSVCNINEESMEEMAMVNSNTSKLFSEMDIYKK